MTTNTTKIEPEHRLLLDLDGVLADFDASVCQLFQKTKADLDEYAEEGRGTRGCYHEAQDELGLERKPVNIFEYMAECVSGESASRFWNRISKCGAPFWCDMPTTPWAFDLIKLALKYFPHDNIGICTSIPLDHRVAEWKFTWVWNKLNKTLPGIFRRTFVTGNKPLIAGPGLFLIDDRQDTVEKFIERGGVGILFPARHNDLWQHANNPMPKVAELLSAAFDDLTWNPAS